MIKHPVILHLSDLHFGNSNRYQSAEAYQTFLRRTIESLDSFKERGVEPNIIVITGDLTEHGLEDEFKLAETFLEGLIKHKEIPKERIVIVPGNHDVNWDLCAAARLWAKGRGTEFKPPYFEKFENFEVFFNNFFAGSYEFTPKLYQVYNYQQYGLIITGFNSCFMESEKDHYGWIGLDQVQNICIECDKIASASKLLRIAVMHHNFKRLSEEDSENLRDADNIRPTLEKGGFRIIMHGHKHFQDLIGLRNLITNFEHVIISTGSTGLDRLPIEGVPSQYQLIKIEPKKVTIIMLQYSTTVISDRGRGKWVIDSSQVEGGIVEIQLDWLKNIDAFSIPFKEPDKKEDITQARARPQTEISIVLMGKIPHSLVKKVINKLNNIQSSFKYKFEDETIELGPRDLVSAYSYPILDKKAEQFSFTHKIPQYLICILDQPIQNNWFGFWNSRRGVFTISDWEEYFAPPSIREYIAYYIANITLYFLTQLSQHEETRSCLKDFCRHKTDIKLGMWSGQLCGDCYMKIQAVINRGEMSSEQFESIQSIILSVREEYRQQLKRARASE